MDMSGSHYMGVPREVVWDALNDPQILGACIPGCESISMVSPTEMTAVVATKLGPIKARFTGTVLLSDIVAPESYVISGEGSGGIAGFAKGRAAVHLAEVDGGTLLTYEVKAQIGGKIAQLGARLIDSVSKKLAEEFFSSFAQRLGNGE